MLLAQPYVLGRFIELSLQDSRDVSGTLDDLFLAVPEPGVRRSLYQVVRVCETLRDVCQLKYRLGRGLQPP